MTWYVYIVRCSDGTLYTGVTTDIRRRLVEHNGNGKGAKYTKARQPVVLVYSKRKKNRSYAQIEEAKLKKLPREEKLDLTKTKK
jgi:putative endonuclease